MTAPSFEEASDKVVEMLADCWSRDRISRADYERLLDVVVRAKTLPELVAVVEELRAGFERVRAVAARIRETAKEVRRGPSRDDGRSLEAAGDQLVEALKALWAEGRLADEDFDRLVKDAQTASTPSELLAVSEETRARVERDRQIWDRLQDMLDWDKPAGPRFGDLTSAPPEPQRLDGASLAARLAPGSLFSARPGYEDRPGQRDMLRFVVDCFNEGGTGLVEAGTGTGKSIAYLLPAADWALRNGEKTIVSTNTINLQEQIVEKDLPMAAEALGGPRVKWALFKGRRNYVSIRRARLAAQSAADLFADGRSPDLEALMDWLDKTQDGSRSDLSFKPAAEVWDEVKSDTDACLGKKCPHYADCHYYRARRRVAVADVLVVNHALFFTDLRVRMAAQNYDHPAVLPRYRRVIFDEAHHLEESATRSMLSRLARPGVLKLLSRLDLRQKGLLAATAAALRRTEGPLAEALLERIAERAPKAVAAARARTDDCFAAVAAWMDMHAGRSDRLRLPAGAGLEPADDPETREALESFLLALGDLCSELGGICERLAEDGEELSADLQGRLLDLRGSKSRLEDVEASLRRCLLPGDLEREDWVRWVERDGFRSGRAGTVVASAPVRVGPLLEEHLFGRVNTAVLTSATLAMDGDFDYVRQWVGLNAPGLQVREEIVESPFDYRRQGLLAVGRRGGSGHVAKSYDRPVSSPRWREMPSEEVGGVLCDLATVAGGGVMALFTSYKALKGVAGWMESHGSARWPVFVQGRKPRGLLIREFARAGNGILLGTASFWEGVDVPGDPLRALLIHKLPFLVPNEPVTAAREELMKASGEDPFLGYSVPVAGLRLKQGVGRLIRSRADRGAIVLLDERIETKTYGRLLKAALPPMPVHYEDWPALRDRLNEFYRASRARPPAPSAPAGPA